jgi:hypothetical protein
VVKMDINVKIILEENIKSYMIKTDKKNLQNKPVAINNSSKRNPRI